MKKLIFILFSLFSLSAMAQERQITTTKDTTYIVWINGLGYERHDVEYEGVDLLTPKIQTPSVTPQP